MKSTDRSDSLNAELLASANHGDAVAQLELAKALLDKTESGRQLALKWLVRSSRSGNVEAISLLRQMLISPNFPDTIRPNIMDVTLKDLADRWPEHDERDKRECKVEIDKLLLDLLWRIDRWQREIQVAGGVPRNTLGYGMALSSIRRFDVLMRASLFRLLPLLGSEVPRSVEDIAKGKPLQRLTFGECIGLLRQFDRELTKGFRTRWPNFDLKGRLVGKKLEEMLTIHSRDRNRIVHPTLKQRDLKAAANDEGFSEEWDPELIHSEVVHGEGLIPFLENVKNVCQSDFMLAVVVASGAPDRDSEETSAS